MSARNGLPSTWHEVRDERTGDLLYWRREHTGYEVHPDCGQYRCELDGVVLGRQPTLTHALVHCRDHMHAADLSTQRISNNTSAEGAERVKA